MLTYAEFVYTWTEVMLTFTEVMLTFTAVMLTCADVRIDVGRADPTRRLGGLYEEAGRGEEAVQLYQ
eukprot:2794508-Rhodomonas_salina.1